MTSDALRDCVGYQVAEGRAASHLPSRGVRTDGA